MRGEYARNKITHRAVKPARTRQRPARLFARHGYSRGTVKSRSGRRACRSTRRL